MRLARSVVLLGVVLACAPPACAGTRGGSRPPPGMPAAPCYPGADVQPPVGTEAADRVSALVLRAYDVRDVLDAMRLVGYAEAEADGPVRGEVALARAVQERLDPADRVAAQVHVTGTGSLIVRAPPAVQARVDDILRRLRDELRTRGADETLSAPAPEGS